jgi:uncharacterized membrane protein YbhN (UPF0104 family)
MPDPATAEPLADHGPEEGPEHGPGSHAALRRIASGALRVTGSRSFKVAFVLVAAGLGGYAVISQWAQVRTDLARLGGMAIGEALLSVLVAWFAMMLVWRILLAASGSRLPVRGAARVFFVGQLGKYLPGSVWPVLAQMELGRAYQVPRQRSATVAVLAMVVSLASALLVALATLPFLGGGATAGYRWAFLLVPVLLVCLHPRVLNPAIGRLLRAARRPAPEQPLTGRAIAAAMGLGVLTWVLAGLHIWLLMVRLGAPAGHSLPVAIGAFAFAWSVGFVIVFAPAGAGVRELILIAALTPVLHSAGAATVVALVSRLVTILADLIAAAASGWSGRARSSAGIAEGPQS